MAGLSQEDRNIIKNHPLANLVDHLRGTLQQAERQYEKDGADESQDQLYRNAISKLLSALQGEEAALNIRSRISDGKVASDLAILFMSLQRANFSYNHYRQLVHLVIQRLPFPPLSPRTSKPGTSTSGTPSLHVDIVLKKELEKIHINIPRFFDAYFKDISQLTAVSQVMLKESEAQELF
ncbi:hypothetical protein BDDG_07638 [Blastomyces dermatitidis ATCC 18188]|uniref:Uncharacterized protein n=1 Tax=Ajellomyces dermatitidis (strain ATCC 18188 / CBS 674.68) TaxID=653446 RepID=F2TN80_AJEDA|nr:hypothetical protein BDDG_07638 [Blastomyces dermatitidis ATCC 18188]